MEVTKVPTIPMTMPADTQKRIELNTGQNATARESRRIPTNTALNNFITLYFFVRKISSGQKMIVTVILSLGELPTFKVLPHIEIMKPTMK
jgi:hypothetical protein